jgi:two-component system CheB/CheR fusion protein
LKNLLANAIKYTRQGFVRLRSMTRGRFVRIEVSDSGIGITPDQIVYIFDEFYQVDVATDNARDGYGLGLSIVQRVSQLLGVQIDVQSEPGAGSTFALEVPASEGNSRWVPQAPTRDSGLLDAPAARRPHVLIVEDDEVVRTATRRFLTSVGYRVTTASSLAETVACLGGAGCEDVGLLITDYHLGGGNTGIEIVRVTRDRFGANFKAVLVTGDTSSEIRELQRDRHLRVISKPIDAEELLGILESLANA